MPLPHDGAQYFALGGMIVAIGATTVEQTGFVPGGTYELKAVGGLALCRWGAGDASAADGGFDFAVGPGTTGLIVVCPEETTAMNVIEAETGSTATATLAISRIKPF
jgi:hypothetical protein